MQAKQVLPSCCVSSSLSLFLRQAVTKVPRLALDICCVAVTGTYYLLPLPPEWLESQSQQAPNPCPLFHIADVIFITVLKYGD